MKQAIPYLCLSAFCSKTDQIILNFFISTTKVLLGPPFSYSLTHPCLLKLVHVTSRVSKSQFLVPCLWKSVPGPMFMQVSSWSQAYASQFLVPCSWKSVPGPMIMEVSSWSHIHCSWKSVPGPMFMEVSSWSLVYWSQFLSLSHVYESQFLSLSHVYGS